jgi:hypothetical protein
MPDTFVRDSSQLRKAQYVYVKDGSAWRKAKNVYVKDGSAWRIVYTGFEVQVNGSFSYSGDALYYYDTEFPSLNDQNGRAQIELNTDGSGCFVPYRRLNTGVWTRGTEVAKAWGSPARSGIGSNYWARLRVSSGTTPGVTAENTWVALTSQRVWTWENNLTTCSFYIDIATSSSGDNAVTSALSTVNVYYVEFPP